MMTRSCHAVEHGGAPGGNAGTLPTAIVLNRNRLGNACARNHLQAAVRALRPVGPPPRKDPPL
ncbi:hypothetical protein [Mycolicibacter arupensis]|uniref:hypothetical protein n=1 Tax=Mycolicibacter arupensis TaxID=342002 RepID=UPI001A98554C|nr:hypothetical protein [Mycolicibacter arupensis]